MYLEWNYKQPFKMICINLETTLAKKMSTRINITVEKQVAVTIWRLATAATCRQISDKFGLVVSSCRSAIQDVISAIIKILAPNQVTRASHRPGRQKMEAPSIQDTRPYVVARLNDYILRHCPIIK